MPPPACRSESGRPSVVVAALSVLRTVGVFRHTDTLVSQPSHYSLDQLVLEAQVAAAALVAPVVLAVVEMVAAVAVLAGRNRQVSAASLVCRSGDRRPDLCASSCSSIWRHKTHGRTFSTIHCC